MKQQLLLLFVFINIFCFGVIYSQNAKVDSIWFDRNDGNIKSSVSNLKDPNVNVTIKYTNEFKGKKFALDPKSIKGERRNTEYKNTYSWDYLKDNGIPIQGKISSSVVITPLAKHTPVKNVAYSFLWPGLGGSKVRSSSAAWIKGIIGWGLLGAGTFYLIQANNNYNNYSKSVAKWQAEDFLSKYNKSFNTGMICLGGAAFVWTVDLMTILAKNHKAKKHGILKDEGFYVPFNRMSYTIKGAEVNIDTRSIYDISMEKANGFYSSQRYDEALHFYEIALANKTNDPEAKEKIRAINDMKFKGKRGLPPNLYAELYFSDDNKNGVLEAMESAILKLKIKNEGEGYANELAVDITDDSTDAAMSLKPVANIDALPNKESVEIEVPISTNINLRSGAHRLEIKVREKYGYDMDPAYLVLNTFGYQPPQLALSGFEIYDRGEGTSAIKADGSVQPGEKVKVKLVLQNVGQSVALNSDYAINTTNENIYLDEASGKLGDIGVGEVKELYFYMSPNKRTLGLDTLPVFLSFHEKLGKGNIYDMQLPIVMEQRPTEPKILDVKPDIASLTKQVAKFEYTSNKFKVNLGQIADIRTVTEAKTKNADAIAIVIGVEKYKNEGDAPYAANDASIMKDYFKKRLGIDEKNIYLFKNDEVTGDKLKEIFDPNFGELQNSVIKGQSDIFVFYSGHGMPNKDGSKIYLYPYNGKKGDAGLEMFAYNIEKFYSDLNQLQARSVTVILDACFSGSSRSTEKVDASNLTGDKGIKVRAKTLSAAYPNFTIITSSSGDETSLGLDASETGLFTYYMCEGMLGNADTNADKKVTLSELKNYVTEKVTAASVKIRGIQTPQFFGDDNKVMVEF